MKNKKPQQLVQSLDRALDVIEKLVESNKSMGVTELSDSLGLHKSTVYRLLATLGYRGYVEQDDYNQYKVGLKLFEIGGLVLNSLDLREQIKPYLKRLREETRETVHLGIMDDTEVVYIDKEETSETIRMYSRIGRRVCAHCTSLGKVILAYSKPKLTDQVIENGLKKYTDKTITDEIEFRKHIKEVFDQGYAIDDEEQRMGIRCIGGPIFNFNRDVIAAFSISAPINRMTHERIDELAEVVHEYSRQISAAFGYKYK
ncbi:IclR family transcriptional regulator [Halocella sp. SP3-1]|uniref:IclR family transcriptional regulator n=1 Tax=Halocella sp. SP3-1 TaxID=2382161 RepID=UPI000F761300|nr:IclR family transcriptional regulator [Halocella sp. SP3-1]AZO93761.1 IclR family transcriptional regulator [Halocella sp. SP3-1]MTI58988.1 IclR family transcriptional regulator [Bacillota bacterium]